MLNKAFFNRVIPFILTFAVGLLVASFFVSVVPSFKFKKNRCGKRHEMRNLSYENNRLRLENQRLQRKLDVTESMILLEAPVPPPPPRVMVMPADSIPTAPRAK